MQEKRNQNGSAVVAIVIIIIVAILASLGFVLWRQLSKKTDMQSPVVKTEVLQTAKPETVQLKTAQIDNSFPIKLAWKYPSTWTMSMNGNGPINETDTTTQTITLTSPSSNYQVIYRVGVNGGLGGSCSPTDNPSTIQYISRQALPSFSQGVFVQAIEDGYTISLSGDGPRGYRDVSGIYNNNQKINDVRVGDSSCNIYLENVIHLSDQENMTLLDAEIKVVDLYGTNAYALSSIDPIKAAYQTSEYKDAIKIMLSTETN